MAARRACLLVPPILVLQRRQQLGQDDAGQAPAPAAQELDAHPPRRLCAGELRPTLPPSLPPGGLTRLPSRPPGPAPDQPQDQIPYSPLYPDIQDWDTPATALDWPLLRASLAHFKQTGSLPGEHRSHDHLNKLESVPVPDDVEREARRLIAEVEEEASRNGEELQWGILDGFLLYYDPVRHPHAPPLSRPCLASR